MKESFSILGILTKYKKILAFCWLQTFDVAFDNNIYAVFFISLAEIGKPLSNSHHFKFSLYLNGHFISRRLSP